MTYDPAAMWAEIMHKIKLIKGGATPAQQYQINKNKQDISVLYGITETIEDLIPDTATVINHLATMSDIATPVQPSETVTIESGLTLAEALAALVNAINFENITPHSYILWDNIMLKCSWSDTYGYGYTGIRFTGLSEYLHMEIKNVTIFSSGNQHWANQIDIDGNGNTITDLTVPETIIFFY